MTITQQINELLSPNEVAEFYGLIADKPGPNYNWYKCPFHHEKTASLRIFHEPTRGFYCEGCHEGGGVVKLVEQLLKVDNMTACRRLDEDFDLGIIDKNRKQDPNKLEKIQRCKKQLVIINDFLQKVKQKFYEHLSFQEFDNNKFIQAQYTKICELELESRKFHSIEETIDLFNYCKNEYTYAWADYIVAEKVINDLVNNEILEMPDTERLEIFKKYLLCE